MRRVRREARRGGLRPVRARSSRPALPSRPRLLRSWLFRAWRFRAWLLRTWRLCGSGSRRGRVPMARGRRRWLPATWRRPLPALAARVAFVATPRCTRRVATRSSGGPLRPRGLVFIWGVVVRSCQSAIGVSGLVRRQGGPNAVTCKIQSNSTTMAIRVVRLGSPRVSGEGTRVGTVRRPPRGVRKEEYAARDFYDVWLPELAPSPELFSYAMAEPLVGKRWTTYARRYRKEMSA